MDPSYHNTANNYIAEAAGALGVICVAPFNRDLHYITDNLGLMSVLGPTIRAHNRGSLYELVDGRRCKLGARPLLQTALHVLNARTTLRRRGLEVGKIYIQHQPSHTGGTTSTIKGSRFGDQPIPDSETKL